MEGSGRGLIQGTAPEIAWRDWGKPRRTSVKIGGLWADICSRNHPNAEQEY
jgi:hypothetical protein